MHRGLILASFQRGHANGRAREAERLEALSREAQLLEQEIARRGGG